MKTIKISKVTSNYLVTRSNLNSFFKSLDKLDSKKIKLDFDGISFISRSCADEYVKLKKKINKQIEEVNMSKDVKAMLELVSSQQFTTYRREEKKECSSVVFL